jgi:ABC-2 type transport system permease protein
MRWHLLLNSLRSRRGGFEVGARIVTQLFFAFVGLSIGIGLGFTAWVLASRNSFQTLALLLWPILIVWQLVPIGIASFQENADLSIFLRFPVGFGSYVLFYILFGLLNVGSIMGGVALLGIFAGASIARPDLILGIALSLALFALFNIFLTRMIFAWIDRWLARRRTREIMGAIFLFLLLGLQLLNPAFYPHSARVHDPGRASFFHTLHLAERAQGFLPPGLAANAINAMHQGQLITAASALFALSAYTLVAASLLGVRLRAEFRGESLGEAPSHAAKAVSVRESRNLLEGPGPIAAVIEKEIHYLMRSGVMLYGFLAPLIMVFIFSNNRPHFGPGSGPGIAVLYALPLGAAYSFLGLTRFIYNNLGGEGAGIQLYFLSPTPFRKIMLAKNIVHVAIFLVELVLVCAIVTFRVGLPGPRILVVTFCWLLFAVPTQLAIGNVLSISMAYRMNMTRMSREQGAAGNGLISLVVQIIIFAIGAAVYVLATRYGHPNLAAPILLVFAAGSVSVWWSTLVRSSAMVEAKKESLISALYRAA